MPISKKGSIEPKEGIMTLDMTVGQDTELTSFSCEINLKHMEENNCKRKTENENRFNTTHSTTQ